MGPNTSIQPVEWARVLTYSHIHANGQQVGTAFSAVTGGDFGSPAAGLARRWQRTNIILLSAVSDGIQWIEVQVRYSTQYLFHQDNLVDVWPSFNKGITEHHDDHHKEEIAGVHQMEVDDRSTMRMLGKKHCMYALCNLAGENTSCKRARLDVLYHVEPDSCACIQLVL